MTDYSSSFGYMTATNDSRCGLVQITVNPPSGHIGFEVDCSPSGEVQSEPVNVSALSFSDVGTPGGSGAASLTVSMPGHVITDAISYRFGSSPPAQPGAPTGLSASLSGSTVNLSWTAPTGGATGYAIYRDSVFLKNVTGTGTTDVPGSGTHTYTAYAYNSSACGTAQGPASNDAVAALSGDSVGVLAT